MLYELLEILMALLAAMGAVSVGWLLFAHWLLPAGGETESFAVIPASGDGVRLDQTVQSLLFLRRNGLYRGNLVILDDGLDEKGRAMARLLCANTTGLLLCSRAELAQIISDT